MNLEFDDSIVVDSSAIVGEGTKVWHHTQIRDGVSIGVHCVIGRNVYIGSGVQIGNRCKVQNNALIYEPARIEDGVFIGPGVILTNDQYPRAINPNLTLKSSADWVPVGVSIGIGASIGAGSVCVAPVRIGDWALVAAGSVVTKDVSNFALVAGVPARRIGWVGKSGHKLVPYGDYLKCPITADLYIESGSELNEVSA